MIYDQCFTGSTVLATWKIHAVWSGQFVGAQRFVVLTLICIFMAVFALPAVIACARVLFGTHWVTTSVVAGLSCTWICRLVAVLSLETTSASACVRRIRVVGARAAVVAGLGRAQVGPAVVAPGPVHAGDFATATVICLTLVDIFIAVRASPRGFARADILITAAGCAFAMVAWVGAAWIRKELAVFSHVITAAGALVAVESRVAHALVLTRRRSAILAALIINSSALNLR